MSSSETYALKEPTINLAIGPSCPVRCEGCYNHFANTSSYGGLITANQVIDFASDAYDSGITQATISGGDPLFHPEIVTVITGLKNIGLKTKLDTVGTPLLGDTKIVYKGKGTVSKIDIYDIAANIDFVSLPLDGASDVTINNFRRGRSNLLQETLQIASILRSAGVLFGFNTVVNSSNIGQLNAIRQIAAEQCANEWQLFEYDDNGPNPSTKKESLKLNDSEFLQATSTLQSDALKITSKSLQDRQDVYFLVDDSGIAYKPLLHGLRRIAGHITNDRRQVISSLRQHIAGLPLS